MGLIKLTRKGDDLDPSRFKNLILDLYSIFPKGDHSGDVENAIRNKSVLTSLVNNGYLILDKLATKNGEEKNGYTLGPNALNLVSTWKMEASARRMENAGYATFCLTIIIVAMTGDYLAKNWLGSVILIALGILALMIWFFRKWI